MGLIQKMGSKDRLLVLDGVAGTLNTCGRTIVFSYNLCASGLEKMYSLAKKPSRLLKTLLVSQKCLLKSKESAQLLKEISRGEYRLNELYHEFGRKSMETSDSADPSATEELQHLLANIKGFKSRIDQLKGRIVKLEGKETADLLLERDISAYVQRIAKKAKPYKEDERRVVEAVRRAIAEVVEHSAFTSEADRITFETVANDLLDPEMDIKTLAAAELGGMRCVASIKVLKEALGFNDPRLSTQIINTLITIGDMGAIPIFYEQLTSPHYRVRIESLFGLSKLADEEEVVSTLLKGLKDRHPEVRMTAITLLGWRKEFEAVSTLMEYKNDKYRCVRVATISALTHIGDRAALPALVDLLGDKSREIRKKALEAIRELSGEDIAFDLGARGRRLRQAVEEVKRVLRERSIPCKSAESRSKGIPASTADATGRRNASRETRKAAKPSPSRMVVVSKKKLEKMVKQQLLSLCRDLNIKCEITERKQQIIAKILKRQKVKRK